MTPGAPPASLMSIGEAAGRVGLRVSAVRFYEAQGLVLPVERRGGRRLYDQEAVERLAIIVLLKNAGFSLAQVADLFARGGTGDESWQALVRERAAGLASRIVELQRMRDYLDLAQSCPSPWLLDCTHLRAAIRDKPVTAP